MKDFEIEERVANILKEARMKSGVSQDFMAKSLGFSKKTIQHIESGDSMPNIKTVIKWFEIIDIPIYPYLFKITHPELMQLNANSTDEEIRKALLTIVSEMNIKQMRHHFFEMFGEHGTAPAGMGEVKTAYLHLPLYIKVSIAEIIATAFELSQARNELVKPDSIMPDLPALKDYIARAKEAAINGKDTYL